MSREEKHEHSSIEVDSFAGASEFLSRSLPEETPELELALRVSYQFGKLELAFRL